MPWAARRSRGRKPRRPGNPDPRARPRPPDTLISRSNLALVLGDLGRLDEAGAEHGAVLETRTRVLGPDHFRTLNSRSNLAHVLYERGRLDEAGAEHRAVLETRTRVLGPDHPSTLTSRGNLAHVLRAVADFPGFHDRNRCSCWSVHRSGRMT